MKIRQAKKILNMMAEEGFLHTQETAVIEIFTTYTI